MWWCGDVVMWCGDVVMWWCGDVVMWWCGDVEWGIPMLHKLSYHAACSEILPKFPAANICKLTWKCFYLMICIYFFNWYYYWSSSPYNQVSWLICSSFIQHCRNDLIFQYYMKVISLLDLNWSHSVSNVTGLLKLLNILKTM